MRLYSRARCIAEIGMPKVNIGTPLRAPENVVGCFSLLAYFFAHLLLQEIFCPLRSPLRTPPNPSVEWVLRLTKFMSICAKLGRSSGTTRTRNLKTSSIRTCCGLCGPLCFMLPRSRKRVYNTYVRFSGRHTLTTAEIEIDGWFAWQKQHSFFRPAFDENYGSFNNSRLASAIPA